MERTEHREANEPRLEGCAGPARLPRDICSRGASRGYDDSEIYLARVSPEEYRVKRDYGW